MKAPIWTDRVKITTEKAKRASGRSSDIKFGLPAGYEIPNYHRLTNASRWTRVESGEFWPDLQIMPDEVALEKDGTWQNRPG
jgi:hypothetical protein